MSLQDDERLRRRIEGPGKSQQSERLHWFVLTQMSRPQILSEMCNMTDGRVQDTIRNGEKVECLGLFDGANGAGVYWLVGKSEMPIRIKRDGYWAIMDVMCGVPWKDWIGDRQDTWMFRGDDPEKCAERRRTGGIV